jgi:hypothetical protein
MQPKDQFIADIIHRIGQRLPQIYDEPRYRGKGPELMESDPRNIVAVYFDPLFGNGHLGILQVNHNSSGPV